MQKKRRSLCYLKRHVRFFIVCHHSDGAKVRFLAGWVCKITLKSLKNAISDTFLSTNHCKFLRSPYLCIVFFIVLDLRLTRLGYGGIPFLIDNTSTLYIAMHWYAPRAFDAFSFFYRFTGVGFQLPFFCCFLTSHRWLFTNQDLFLTRRREI